MDIPEKFPDVIRDFLADLSTTFPEYIKLWENWQKPDCDISPLYEYCLKMYPERFFDILYQNNDIFKSESTISTMFLPNVDFKMLFSLHDISDKTKEALWKYLQLVLITIMGNIKSSTSFGDTAGLFEGVGEEELQQKLSDTIEGLSGFFKGMSKDCETDETDETDGMGSMGGMEKAFENMFSSMNNEKSSSTSESNESNNGEIPNADDLHSHLKTIFEGKIGTLAKELAEELSEDVISMFPQDGDQSPDTSEMLKRMMRNPKKIMDLVKKVGTKLDDKMKSGSISKEDLMTEASDMMSKMKGMGDGKVDMQEMMEKMMSTMGVSKGMFDMNKMSSMMGKNTQKEKMRAKLDKRKEEQLKQTEQLKQANYILEAKAPNEFVFKLPDDGVQEKSKAPINDDWLIETPITKNTIPSGKGKKKGGKKGK
jgi:hypothetical protein